MTVSRTILGIAAPAALLLLGGCASSFKANVSRFQAMPAPQGQTFTIRAADPRQQGGLEFGQYASLVAARLAQAGYRPVEAGPASLVVTLDYGVDNGHEKVVSTPGYGGFGPGWGYGGFGGGFGGYGGYGGFGRFGGRGWYGGWNDPFWGGGFGGFGGTQVDSYTYYVSFLDLQIRRAGDDRTVFEGKAKARSVDDSLPHLVPNLIEAMFVGFPGRSGEQVLITIPPADKAGQRPEIRDRRVPAGRSTGVNAAPVGAPL